MSYLPKPTDGGDFTPAPAGNWPAVCTRFIDLGTQKSVYQGDTKLQHKVMLTWELRDDDALMADGRPFTLSQRYTWSMSEKATLRKHLEGWRGKAFEDSDFGEGGFDVRNIVGKPCFLNVVQKQTDGKTYSNVASIGKVIKGMTVSPPVNELVYIWLSIDRFDQPAFDKLSEGLQAIIKGSPEYAELMNNLRSHHNATPDADRDLNDEVPF